MTALHFACHGKHLAAVLALLEFCSAEDAAVSDHSVCSSAVICMYMRLVQLNVLILFLCLFSVSGVIDMHICLVPLIVLFFKCLLSPSVHRCLVHKLSVISTFLF